MTETSTTAAPITGLTASAPPPPARNPSWVLSERYFFDWLWPRRRQAFMVMILTFALAAVASSYPAIIKHASDALFSGNSSAVPWILLSIIGVTVLKSTLLYYQTLASNDVIQRMSTDIQKHVFKHVVNADFASLTRDAPGRLLSKILTDIHLMQNAAQTIIGTSVRDVLTIVGYIASMIYLDWALSLIVLGIYPLAVLPILMISKHLRKVVKQTQTELGGMVSLVSEQLSSPRLIKTFRLEDYANTRVGRSFDEVLRLRTKAVKSRARLDPILEVLGGVAIAGVIGFAYWRISRGTSSIGDFVGFVTALLLAAQPVRALGALSTRIQEGLAGAESMYGILDEKPVVIDRPATKDLVVTKGEIAFDDVTFAYGRVKPEDEEIQALAGVSIVVPGGKTVALVGRSGSGKSTLINLVPRLFDVTAGSIRIDNQDLRDVTLASLRSQIAIVSQDVTLFDDTIRANIALGRLDASEDAIIAAAKAAAAHDFIMAQPNGYDTGIGDRGQRLSGGQRQRLALARAILRDAPILLLDEATSALDTESERLVQDALAKFTRNRTTLVIAHRLSTVQNADIICVMEEGRIIESGSHAELFAKGGSYANLCRQQFMSGEGGTPAAQVLPIRAVAGH